jgi:predicted transposase/invertase (TIGR01784 family)
VCHPFLLKAFVKYDTILPKGVTMERKLISFDWAIKRILRSKANFEILEGFLSELLFEDITILEILESESNQSYKEDKFNRLDIKVKNQNQEVILIEIQYSSKLDYLQRILYASSKAVITEHLRQGDPFSEVTKVISISILYFDFGDGDDYIYKGTTNFIGLHNHTKLQLNTKQQELYKVKSVEKIYPEYYLIKVRNFDDNSKDTLDEWIHFLKNEEIPEYPKAKGLLKAKEELDYLKMDKEEQSLYNKHQMDKHHEASLYESTYVIGKLDGEKNKTYEIAKNLLDILDNQTIANKTGLSIKEVENLRK